MRRKIKKYLTKVLDLIFFPVVVISAFLYREVRRVGIQKFPLTKKTLIKIGVMPIRDQYYEPLFNAVHLKEPLSKERSLNAINWNAKEQVEFLRSFKYQDELQNLSDVFVNDTTFHFNNGSFESGDAEYWYQMIRLKKPKKIMEIGSGNSTKIARLAIEANGKNSCEHICIEPYEMPWLEKISVQTIREKVENIPIDFFKKLEAGDILFIDSSHVIRPQGDVLHEYLQILPSLNSGVIVHIHDIFSPRDYPHEWIIEEIRLWNEQYLLEAFLSNNNEWKILGAVNYLRHHYFDLLSEKCPRLIASREPASFYMVKS
ncbi:MAG: class I SAM-dependent methyltransferase [Bacteroidetes bacterium]|nr:class I SAM-dependent methyltransferase [Bacteroidota bacterium]MBU1372224.1 class I SAM-dependent methyltransferase [Bacteroidota bacterium]MBU1484475.1 class I SAM-dependent methyltransferase [Bacteroidota bacterium]MBU1760193.1 class I SAM-dependent methyltransferase [Bacteroidota bacterium]MBU2045636.1 class I SAM-dependent methyltransferase [Bacteroidota bacterium]